jgi:hypothetical protein
MSAAWIEHEHCQVIDVFAQFGTHARANDERCEIVARYASRYTATEPQQDVYDVQNPAQDVETPNEVHDTPTTQAGDTRPWWRRVFGG